MPTKTSMQTVVLRKPLDLQIEERDIPVPGPGEVLVRVERGGICGSDLHYYHHGGFGVVRMNEALILGHEIAGHIEDLGSGVTEPKVGTLVAVNPSTPCGVCSFCLRGESIHCLDMRFLGSAMRTPHVQGGFAQYLTCKARNAVPVLGGNAAAAAFAEPLAVSLHAVGQTPVYGRRVLIIGAGPIGALLIVAARFAGAREILVVDVKDEPLSYARKVGADATINSVSDPAALEHFSLGKGYFDVTFEAAGQGTTVMQALKVTRPRGTVVLVGQGATIEFPGSIAVTKELRLVGSFRFDDEFALAADLIGQRRVDVSPLLSDALPVSRATQAFELAADKSRAMKVQLDFV